MPYELSSDVLRLQLSNAYDLRKLENTRRISQLGGGIVYYPVSLQEMKLYQ